MASGSEIWFHWTCLSMALWSTLHSTLLRSLLFKEVGWAHCLYASCHRCEADIYREISARSTLQFSVSVIAILAGSRAISKRPYPKEGANLHHHKQSHNFKGASNYVRGYLLAHFTSDEWHCKLLIAWSPFSIGALAGEIVTWSTTV